MLDLRLRTEFLADQLRDTTTVLHRNDHTGAIDISAGEFFAITYPSLDLQRTLRALRDDVPSRPVVLIAERGRGKSHIMAAVHHAFSDPQVVEQWIQEWTSRGDASTETINTLHIRSGYLPITVSMQDNEYTYLWDVLFNNHPEGARFKGRFEASKNPVPPSALIKEMLEIQPVALILDELQTWYDGRQDEPESTGKKARSWAFNFIQNIASIATEHPERLILVASVRNNTSDAYQQIHREDPVQIDFLDASSRSDRQRLVLHRIFNNRNQISRDDVMALTTAYRESRFRLLIQKHDAGGREKSDADVLDAWPFAPELFTVLEDQILRSSQAQGLRDLLRILVHTYREQGNKRSILTLSDFNIANIESHNVQVLIDSIAESGQGKLREIAIRNYDEIAVLGLPLPNVVAAEVMSALWMRSFAVESQKGATATQLHVDITHDRIIDDNSFSDELGLIVANSFNIHQTTESGETRYIFREEENPRALLVARAKNDALFPNSEDIMFLRKRIRLLLSPANVQFSARVIVLGNNWQNAPWSEFLDENDAPSRWERPVMIVLPENPPELHRILGTWLKNQVPVRRNTVRFLFSDGNKPSLFSDTDVIQCARIAYLAEKWGEAKYQPIGKEYLKKLDELLDHRFSRFAILRTWNYQDPAKCSFTIEKISDSIGIIGSSMDIQLKRDLFLSDVFAQRVVVLAAQSRKVSALLEMLREPPGNPEQEALAYLGEPMINEQLLHLVAQGKIAVRVANSWLVRQGNESDDETYARIRSQGFKTGRDLAEMGLELPEAIGTAAIGDVPFMDTVQPMNRGPFWNNGETDPASLPTETRSYPANPSSENSPPVNGYTDETTVTLREMDQQSIREDIPVAAPRRRRRSDAKRPMNLMTDLERWGVESRSTIPVSHLEIRDMTVNELRAALGRLPSHVQVVLEIETDEEQEA